MHMDYLTEGPIEARHYATVIAVPVLSASANGGPTNRVRSLFSSPDIIFPSSDGDRSPFSLGINDRSPSPTIAESPGPMTPVDSAGFDLGQELLSVWNFDGF
jgi:hypothetical protein